MMPDGANFFLFLLIHVNIVQVAFSFARMVISRCELCSASLRQCYTGRCTLSCRRVLARSAHRLYMYLLFLLAKTSRLYLH